MEEIRKIQITGALEMMETQENPSPPSPTSPASHPSPASLHRLSQGHLNLLSTCPRKFQHVFLEQLSSPNPVEQQEKQNQGARFHLLLQQWQLGLPVAAMVQEDNQLRQWFDAFVQASPKILEMDQPNQLRLCEHQRTLELNGYLLTVVYDLVILGDRHARILDWKTYPRPQTSRWLAQNWQTRLYPFVLAETSHYAPDQIAMLYWFFQSQTFPSEGTNEPQSLTFAGDRAQHEKTRQNLTQLLHQLTQWLKQYQTGEPFPQVPPESAHCATCSFAVRCDREPSPFENRETAPSEDRANTLAEDRTLLLENQALENQVLDDIPEIPL